MRVRSVLSGLIMFGLLACGQPSVEHPAEPTLRADRNVIDFGGSFGTAVWLMTEPQESLLLENLGMKPLVIERVDKSGDTAFKIDLPSKLEIDPLGHSFIRITFAPTEEKTYAGAITIFSNSENEPEKTIMLSGTGVKRPEE